MTCCQHIIKIERQNFRTGPRIEPKFGTHVRIDTLTLKTLKKWTDHPTPGGLSEPIVYVLWRCAWRKMFVCGFVADVYASLTYFGTRPSDRAQIWHECADRYSHLKNNNFFDPPHPRGGLGGYILLKICCIVRCREQ